MWHRRVVSLRFSTDMLKEARTSYFQPKQRDDDTTTRHSEERERKKNTFTD
jgi:hypothetical protein